MANPIKGEVDLPVDGKTFTLCLGINEIVELETVTDTGIVEIAGWFADRSKLRVGNMRAVLWASLQKHHPEISLEGAGEMIGKVGLLPIVERLADAIQAAFPEAETGAKPNPPAGAQAGTGTSS